MMTGWLLVFLPCAIARLAAGWVISGRGDRARPAASTAAGAPGAELGAPHRARSCLRLVLPLHLALTVVGLGVLGGLLAFDPYDRYVPLRTLLAGVAVLWLAAVGLIVWWRSRPVRAWLVPPVWLAAQLALIVVPFQLALRDATPHEAPVPCRAASGNPPAAGSAAASPVPKPVPSLGEGLLRWCVPLSLPLAAVPAVDGGAVYVAALDGNVYALATATGAERWRASTGGVGPSAAVGASTVYAVGTVSGGAGRAGVLDALDATTGRPRWRATLGDPLPATPTVAGGAVYVATTGCPRRPGAGHGAMVALDATNGALRWCVPTITAPDTRPIVADGAVYVAEPHRLHALAAKTGAERWSVAVPAPAAIVAAPAVAGSTVYLGTWGRERHFGEGLVIALDATTGAERWRFTARDNVAATPAVAGGLIFAGSDDHVLYALDIATGSPRWHFATGDLIAATPAALDGLVYVASDNGRLNILDAATGRLRRHVRTAGAAGSPTITAATIYLPCAGPRGGLYAFRQQTADSGQQNGRS